MSSVGNAILLRLEMTQTHGVIQVVWEGTRLVHFFLALFSAFVK